MCIFIILVLCLLLYIVLLLMTILLLTTNVITFFFFKLVIIDIVTTIAQLINILHIIGTLHYHHHAITKYFQWMFINIFFVIHNIMYYNCNINNNKTENIIFYSYVMILSVQELLFVIREI